MDRNEPFVSYAGKRFFFCFSSFFCTHWNHYSKRRKKHETYQSVRVPRQYLLKDYLAVKATDVSNGSVILHLHTINFTTS